LRRDPAQARHYFERALAIYRRIGDRHGEGTALCCLGNAYERLGEYIQARACDEQALSLLRQTGDQMAEGEALSNLSQVCRLSGSYAAATVHLEQALQIFRDVGSVWNQARTSANLGILYFEFGNYTKARDYRERTLDLFRDMNSRAFEGWALYQLGQTFHLQGDYASAGTYYEQALHIGRETGDWEIEAKALTYKGLLSHHLNDDPSACAYCQQVLCIIPDQDLGRALDLVYVYVVLGHALAGLGSLTEAADAYRQALTTRREFLVAEPTAGLARVALAQGDLAGAQAHVDGILDYMADRPALEGTKEPLRIYLTCYRVLSANGDRRAAEILDTAYRLLQERAATIEDENLRRSYLENVPAHREIVALWEKTTPRPLSASRGRAGQT